MNKTVSVFCVIVSLLSLGISLIIFTQTRQSTKVAYIELIKVFNGFDMTQQYKKKLEAVMMNRKMIMDSMALGLKARSRSFGNTKPGIADLQDFEYEKELYAEKLRQFEEDNQALSQQYDIEINKQLNQYVKEYGQKNGFRYIYGAQGSGVLMYAREEDNVTEEVLRYINERYKGNAK